MLRYQSEPTISPPSLMSCKKDPSKSTEEYLHLYIEELDILQHTSYFP